MREEQRRRWNFKLTFDRFIRDLRRYYPELFEDLEGGMPPLLEKERYHISLPDGVSAKPILDEELGERYEKEVLREIEELGIEAIAIYVPYHLTKSWGIYIFLEKLSGLAFHVSQRLGIAFSDAFHSCGRAVIEHELFHFHTEYSATIIETVVRRRIYLPYLRASRPYDKDEEAIANAWMLTSRSPYIRRKIIRSELKRLCDMSPPGYRDYGKYLAGDIINYDRVKEFWAQRFLDLSRLVLLPVRLEMPSSYALTPIYYVQILKASELRDALCFISNNWRIEDVVKKLKKILPDEITEASATGIRLKTGQFIPIHYHPKEGGVKLVKLVNEVADKLNLDRKWLREHVFRLRD